MLSRNLTYAEIAEATHTKITTVREHITKIYEKLEVSDSKSAVIKGRALGLLEK